MCSSGDFIIEILVISTYGKVFDRGGIGNFGTEGVNLLILIKVACQITESAGGDAVEIITVADVGIICSQAQAVHGGIGHCIGVLHPSFGNGIVGRTSGDVDLLDRVRPDVKSFLFAVYDTFAVKGSQGADTDSIILVNAVSNPAAEHEIICLQIGIIAKWFGDDR